MSNTLTYFTALGYWDDIEVSDPSGTVNDLQVQTFSAFITFHPRVSSDFVLYVAQLAVPGDPTPVDRGIALAPIRGRTTHGRLCTIDMADAEGVRLLAATPAIASALAAQGIDSLIWDVEFTGVNYGGVAHTMKNFGFTAPASDTAVTITASSLTRLAYSGPGSGDLR